MEDFLTAIGVEEGWLALAGEALVSLAVRLLAAIATFIIGRIAAGLARQAVKSLLRAREVDATVASFVGTLVYVAVLAIATIAALAELGVQTASVVAMLGAAGLAIGLALQGSLANFAAGVLLVIFRPFKAGDYVEAGGTGGTVEEVQLFATVLKTPDNRKVIVPNGKIYSDNITNYSAEPIRRLDLVFGVSYSDDLNRAEQIVWEVLRSDPRVLDEPEPTVGILELADSSINFAVRPWVESANYFAVLFDLNKTIKQRFDAAGISIPFPQQDVYVHNAN